MDNPCNDESRFKGENEAESSKLIGEFKAGFYLVSGLNKINNDLRGTTIQKPDAERALELLKIIEEHVRIVTKP